MTIGTGGRRRLRLLGVGALAAALVAGLALATGVGRPATRSAPRVAASLTSATSQLYVTGNLGIRGELERFSLNSVLAGGATPNNGPAPRAGQLGPVAVNRIAASALIGGGSTGESSTRAPYLGTVDVAGGGEQDNNTGETPDAEVADPTDSSRFYVLEDNGSSGQIDRVDLSTNPPSDTVLVPGSTFPSNSTGPLTSLAISPDGQTLFVGEDGDSLPAIGVIPVANPAASFALDERQVGAVRLEGLSDLVVGPRGQRLYAAGPGFSGNQSVGEVFSLQLPITSPTQSPAWSLALPQMSEPTCLTVNPQASMVVVGGFGGNGSSVQEVSVTGSPIASAPVPIAGGNDGPGGLSSIAETPNGQAVVVAGLDGSSGAASIYPLNASTLALGPRTALPARFDQIGPQSLAITPDSAAPVGFTGAVNQAGAATTFTASPLSAEFGTVTDYAWSFGDGATASGGPTTSHVYASVGNFTVGLTETVSAGFRLSATFTVDGPGQTPYWLANLQAAQTISVPATPPTNGTTTTTTTPGTTTTTRGSTLPTTVPGQPTPGVPNLVLSPTVGPPGTIVSVTGTGFRPNAPVTVSWSVSTGSVVIVADAQGDLPPTLLFILTPDLLGPRQAVASSTPRATAPFLVVPASSEPGGDNASLLFRSEGP